MDGDGDPDVISVSALDDTVAWYENEGEGAFSAPNVITDQARFAQSVHAADMDGDGDIDVLSASFDDDKVAWYENEGAGASWTAWPITAEAAGPVAVHATDLDGDGDADVLFSCVYGEATNVVNLYLEHPAILVVRERGCAERVAVVRSTIKLPDDVGQP